MYKQAHICLFSASETTPFQRDRWSIRRNRCILSITTFILWTVIANTALKALQSFLHQCSHSDTSSGNQQGWWQLHSWHASKKIQDRIRSVLTKRENGKGGNTFRQKINSKLGPQFQNNQSVRTSQQLAMNDVDRVSWGHDTLCLGVCPHSARAWECQTMRCSREASSVASVHPHGHTGVPLEMCGHYTED